MPIIVDKTQKKRDIALACKPLLLSRPLNELTISEIAKTAGIGKGTFYEYFDNKEELLFTLVDMLMARFNAVQERRLAECATTREKLKCFAGFFYEKEAAELRTLYKSFVGVSLIERRERLVAFQTECLGYYYAWFERLIEEGVRNGEIVPQSKALAKGLFATAKGMFVISETTRSLDNIQAELERFVDTLFQFLEIKDTDAS